MRLTPRFSWVLIFSAVFVLGGHLKSFTDRLGTLQWGEAVEGGDSASVEAATPPSPPSAAPPPPAATTSGKAEPAATAVAKPATLAPPPDAKLPETGSAFDLLNMSPKEIEALQTLKTRRAELEHQAADVTARLNQLKVTESQVDKKVTRLVELEAQLKTLLDQYHKQEEEKTKNIAKIYETMKPKDAARIFEALDLPVLMDIVDNMKESKLSPIIASMNTDKAKELTAQLRARRRL